MCRYCGRESCQESCEAYAPPRRIAQEAVPPQQDPQDPRPIEDPLPDEAA